MRNDRGSDEYAETPPVRRCGHCGEPLLTQRARAKFCTRECKELAREARKRARDRVAMLRQNHPFADESLSELADEFGMTDGLLDDEDQADPGHAPDPWQVGNETFSTQMALQAAIDAIDARYERKLRPYRDQIRRNIGVKPVAMARLEQARDSEISALVREYEHAAALGRAVRTAPQRLARAQERQNSIQNMAAFSRDLGRGGRYRPGPEDTTRATSEVFAFPEQAHVFGTDSEVYQQSAVARELGMRVYSPDGWM